MRVVVKTFYDIARHLVWLTQFGMSVAVPPVLSLCGHGNIDGCHGMRHRGDLQFRWRKVFLVDDGRWEWRARVGGVWTDWHPTVDEMDWSC